VSDRVDIEELRRLAANVAEHMSDDRADMIDLAADEIARLREERRWISVGERLPTDEEWVDVAGDWGDFVGWYDSKWHNLFDDDPGEVTHWRKRPPGPEGDGNG
jgi:hypothetical protein